MNLDEKIEEERRRVAQNPDNPALGATLIQLLMQKGEMEVWRVETCAQLNDPACRILYPKEPVRLAMSEVLKNFGKSFIDNFSLWVGEKALPIWEKEFPGDKRPRALLEGDIVSWHPTVAEMEAFGDIPMNAAKAVVDAHAAITGEDLEWAAYDAAGAAFYATLTLGVTPEEAKKDNRLLIEYIMLGNQ